MTGCDKFADEKQIIKLLRKLMASELLKSDLPFKAIAKKRGNTFAFLQFADDEQRNRFTEIFTTVVIP